MGYGTLSLWTTWFLWLLKIGVIETTDKTVDLISSCPAEHGYTLGRGDSLSLEVRGWPQVTCTASLFAAKGCSRVCVQVEAARFDWCAASLSVYDSHVSDFRSAQPAMRRGCPSGHNTGGRVWCSSGRSATVRIEALARRATDSRHKIAARLRATADCPQPIRQSVTKTENTDTILIGRMILIGIILGAVFGGILLASVCCTVIYCACLRNKTRQDNTAYISLPAQPTAPPETIRQHAQFRCGHQSPPISNPTYQQPKGSVIPIKTVSPHIV